MNTANHSSDTIAIIYPNRRVVSAKQIKDWAHDDLANEEGRHALDDLPLALSVAIVDYYGRATIAAGHGLELLEYSAGDAIPGIRFTYDCKGHMPGPFDPMGETMYCDGSCRNGS